VQAAFSSSSTTTTAIASSNNSGSSSNSSNNTVWVPRDAYQQRAFATPVTDARDAAPGDLLFFGPSQDKVDHVAVLMSFPEVGLYKLNPVEPGA
jgi:hypothetical protein